MNGSNRREIEELLQRVVSLTAEEQRAYLEEHCRDAALRAEVEKRLDYHRTDAESDTVDVAPQSPGVAVQASAPGRGNLPLPLASRPSSSSTEFGHGRFLPGTVIGERYRIVGLLGKGGMGEVYRADDLELGQSVALKFLPERLARDQAALERFRGEVRLARQVSHPNVCRVYDIGQVDEHYFLSMEYVDGEDLGSLLKRIGRFPGDRATRLARQLCLGLAAAHEKGVLHRDLKPANIMVDGRGKLLITDFGLAELAGGISSEDVRSGTPAYMAPEQLAGREVTERSDIYSLGLVLHEVFTGKPVWEAGTLAELFKERERTPTPTPSRHVDNLDPAVERVIQRCLEADPSKRPSSAVAVTAALPGGDPLQAALAAGETPSPELVAAQGSANAMSPPVALTLAVLIVAGVVLAGVLSSARTMRSHLQMDKPPAAMVDRAQEIIRALGYTERVYAEPKDTAFGYSPWVAVNQIWDSAEPEARLAALADAGQFWYRQSPMTFDPNPVDDTFAGGPVERWNPFPKWTGEILVGLSLAGRLQIFVCAPRRFYRGPAVEGNPNWSLGFELAGLNIDDFESVEPRYQRFMQVEQRAAWVGVLPGSQREVRIEAGTSEGRLALWAILSPTELESQEGQPENYRGRPPTDLVRWVISTVVFVVAALLARSNLRRGRADRRGAWRLGGGLMVIVLATEMLRSHAIASENAVRALYPVVGTGLTYGGVFMLCYLAVEPYARRVWPSMLVSWSRLLGRSSHDWRDPLLGRSVLGGLAAGTALLLVNYFKYVILDEARGGPIRPTIGNWDALLGQRYALAAVLKVLTEGITESLFLACVLVISRLVLKRTWLAVLASFVIFLSMSWGAVPRTPEMAIVGVAVFVLDFALRIGVLLRFGLVGMIAAVFVFELRYLTRTADWTAWHSQPAIMAMVAVAALAAYGCWAATAGKRFAAES